MDDVYALSSTMFASRGEQAVLRLALAAVAQLSACRAVAGYLVRDGELDELRTESTEPDLKLAAQVKALSGVDGAVDVTGERASWAWAYALRSQAGQHGYLVVAAPDEPSAGERFLLTVLVQQTSAALSNAVLHRIARAQAAQLRALTTRLTAVTDELDASMSALQRQRRIHEVLSRVSAAGEGEAGIARAVHQLTGLAVAVEDRFGNLRVWAGPGCPDPYSKPNGRRRSQLLARALRECGPVRDGDRVVALAQPRHEVLGVLVLLDQRRTAGEHELFALQHGATVLAEELAHQRSLTEVELRMRRDLVDDLLGGADAGVFARAEALGHDLHRPHRVIVMQWGGIAPACSSDCRLARVAGKAASELQLSCLVATRGGAVILLASHPSGCGDRLPWEQMYRAVAGELRSDTGAIGVGGRADQVGDIPRSHQEALRAIAIRQGSVTPHGVTVFDDLGVYRVLAVGESAREVKAFVREWLGPLLDYDQGHRCDLVHTLSTYLECGGNYDETAAALTIHRSTLRYRLQRIRQVSGLDLGEVDNRFNLHVATRARRVLEDSS